MLYVKKLLFARYFYYTHGALARTEIGEQVAGNDHRYSLQGWIMGVNGLETDTTNPTLDPSKDGFTDLPNFNRWQARDEFAYALGYHDSAYVGIGNPNLGLVADAWNIASNSPSGLGDDMLGIGDRKGLNNGNIAFILVNVPQFERQEQYTSIAGFAYQYDQLHRIRQSVDYFLEDGKVWKKANCAKTAYTYDPNGNILTLQRTAPNAGAGSGSTDIDDLKYLYFSNTNRLRVVDDNLGAPHAGFGDIGSTSKYYYNAIGQLVRDDATIASIDWNIQGKVDLVKFGNGNPNVAYTYDPLGNRLTKRVADTITYYIRDAQGNSFATYQRVLRGQDTTRLIEQYLYASSRLGVRSADIIVKIRYTNALLPDSARCFSTAVGAVSFEQTNHLGDVVVTLSDKVLGADVDADNTIDYYKSIVKSASLTYPFGWDIPNRKYSNAPDYRFGFNGKENDKEWNVQDYGFRLYDTRIARFISVDPITAEYPELTPYQFASNSPIKFIDLDGLERAASQQSLQAAASSFSNPKLGFGSFALSKSQSGWTKVQDDFHLIGRYNETSRKSTKNPAMQLEATIKPSEAFKSISTSMDGTYQMDCAMHTQAVFLYAVMLDMEQNSPGSFDLSFTTAPKKKPKEQTYEFVLDVFVSSQVSTIQSIRYDEATKAYYDITESAKFEEVIDYPKQGTLIGAKFDSKNQEQNLIANAPIGTRLGFTAKGTATNPTWQNENVLKIGNNSFSAHPFGVVTYDQLMSNLKNHHSAGYKLTQYDVLQFDDSSSKPKTSKKKKQ